MGVIEKNITFSLEKSWDIFKKEYATLILATLITIIGSLLIVTIAPLLFGLYYVTIQLFQGNKVKPFDVMKGFNYFWKSWGIIILAILSIIIGLILLIIPGLFLIVFFQYVVVISLIEKKGVIDSLKRSYAIGRENVGFSIILMIITLLINGVGGITYVCTLFTIPFTTLLIIGAYTKISK